MDTLVFATNNAHKLHELRRMLGDRYRVLGLEDIGCHDDIPENEDTFEGNALAKARWVAERYGCDCAADDSGLSVDALGGAPGVLSARFSGVHGDSEANNRKLLAILDGVDDRSAAFHTVIALVRKGKEPQFFRGSISGTILREPHGTGGFGYDPLFVPDGWTQTFAEVPDEAKNAVSHRGKAVAALCKYLDSQQLNTTIIK